METLQEYLLFAAFIAFIAAAVILPIYVRARNQSEFEKKGNPRHDSDRNPRIIETARIWRQKSEKIGGGINRYSFAIFIWFLAWLVLFSGGLLVLLSLIFDLPLDAFLGRPGK